ncbi:MAG: hypothetical protein WD077_01965 [Bacteroidia bacterium]
MRYIVILLIGFMAGFSASDAGAQVRSSSEYSYDGSDRESNFDDGIENVKHIFKVNPLNIFIGDFPVYYEHKLDKRLSVEVGAGYTFRNYIFGIWQTTASQVPEFIDIREAEPGFSARASLRYFPNKLREGIYDIEGFYFGPEIQYKAYNMSVLECDPDFPNRYTENTKSEHRNLLDIKITFGYQQFYSGNFIVDFYGGIGVRSKDQNLHFCDWDETQRSFLSTPENVKTVVPVISAGFKFGLGTNF